MFRKTLKIDGNCFSIVADGAMSNHHTADGRLIPIVILDCSDDTTLSDLISFHSASELGDANSTWGIKRFSKNIVFLIIDFVNPVGLHIAIKFNVNQHHSIIDGIIHSRAVYIQPGKIGDRVSHDINADKLLIEIPKKTTFDSWDKILYSLILKKFKKEGVSRKNIKSAVTGYISTSRDAWGKRLV